MSPISGTGAIRTVGPHHSRRVARAEPALHDRTNLDRTFTFLGIEGVVLELYTTVTRGPRENCHAPRDRGNAAKQQGSTSQGRCPAHGSESSRYEAPSTGLDS